MSKTAWPTGPEVSALIATIPDATAPTDNECADLVLAVVADFETRTGRIPFLSSGSSAVPFDPPDGRDGRYSIDIQARSVDSVKIDVTPSLPAGLTLTAGTDYILEPADAAAKDRPYESLRFLCRAGYYPQSVVITAPWGWGTTIPYDLWKAVQRMAAIKAIEETMALSGPVKEIKQGTLERQYGIRGARTLLEDWTDDYEAQVSKFTFIPGH